MAGIETWLLGYAGGRLLDAILSKGEKKKFIKKLNDAVSKWASELPEYAYVHSSIELFPNPIIGDDIKNRTSLKIIHDRFKKSEIPTIDEWHNALLEQYLHIKKTIPDAQAFFRINEEDARKHLLDLSQKLREVCIQDEKLFKGTMIKIVNEINDALNTNGPQKEPENLTDKQKALLIRLYEYLEEGFCKIYAPKGEYKCLWVPSYTGDMQWGWERTPREAELSGKSIGDRRERLEWIYVVEDLLKLGFIQKVDNKDSCFELSETGKRKAHDLFKEVS